MPEIRIDIGCGINRHKDCNIGLDRHDFSDFYEPSGFIVHDVVEPLPFDDCSVDWIYTHHLLEHLPHRHPTKDIDAMIFAINEFQRVLRYGCEAFIVVPWIEHTNAWRHPTHYRFFNYDLFHWFDWRNQRGDHEAESVLGKWKVIENRIQDECHIVAILRKIE